MTRSRIAAFASVGVMGFTIQLATLAALTWLAGWPYLPATCVAVEAAVLHNFVWHERWTWADRRLNARTVAARFARFNLTTGLTSIVGNLALMAIFVQGFGANPIVANVITVASLSVVNFLVADSWVFAVRALVLVSLTCSATPAFATEPARDTIAAWEAFANATEARIRRDSQQTPAQSSSDVTGETISVAGGLIHHWTGALFVRGVTLDTVLGRLLNPGTPPPQEDVLEARVLARPAYQSLRVYLKLTRRTIVTATYDTEHDVTFTRLSPKLAISRSVATRIVEVGGENRGFLWRLNSYWRYQEVPGGVMVTMESLTLSRDVPTIVRPLAMPIVSRVARESVTRTLNAFRSWFEPTPQRSL
jgi:putative flippase GtrA